MSEITEKLSIRFSADGFSFAIYHTGTFRQEILLKESMPIPAPIAKLRQLFKETDILNRPYKDTHIFQASNRFAIIPLHLFDQSRIETTFGYSHTKKENEIILYNTLPKNDMAVIFAMEEDIYRFLSHQYPCANFYSQATSVIEYFSNTGAAEGLSKRMYVCPHGNSKNIDICCFEFKRLLFINSFECKTIEESMYYILHTWQQLDFNQETNKLYLIGTPQGEDKAEFIRQLRRYIFNILTLKEVPPPFDLV